METKQIVVELDAEISRLQQARAILDGTSTTPNRRTKPFSGRRAHSAETRERIAAAQRKSWKARMVAKKAA
jgi:hypothetical protein